MRVERFIALRYLFSRRQKSVINFISWISLTGIAVGAMALIIVLSVYNGIGNLTQSLFNVFDPPLIVTPQKGKTFHLSQFPMEDVAHINGVEDLSAIVEENAWVTYNQNQYIVALRGVDSAYARVTGLDTMLYSGVYQLKSGSVNYLLLGAEVYYQLGIHSLSNAPIAVHIPHRQGSIGLSMEDALNTQYALPGGTFFIQQDIDDKYVVSNIEMVRELMDYSDDECTALAIKVSPQQNIAKVKSQLLQLLPEDQFVVKDRYEQQPLYYKIFRSERLGIFLILSLIVIISTLNLVASLFLLIIDKRRDISTMRSMGMQKHQISKTFFIEGVLISIVGVVIGIAIGFVVCFLQQHFGLIKMGDGNFVVKAFPVAMRLSDFIATFILVMALSTLSVWLTVRRAFR